MIKWLKMGIALYLAFHQPTLIIDGNDMIINLELKNILTDEMRGLLHHGVDIEYQLYSSISYHTAGKKRLQVRRVNRKLHYNYLEDVYILYEEERILLTTPGLSAVEKQAGKYEINFDFEESDSFSVFAQIILRDNPVINDTLKMDTMDLWDDYSPSIEHTFKPGR